MDQETAQQLARTGLLLVRLGVLILDAVAVFIALVGAWFISTFSDGSAQRGLAVVTDLWPVWVVAAVFIVVVVVAAAGLGMLPSVIGEFGRAPVLLALVAGGLTLAVGAAARLASH